MQAQTENATRPGRGHVMRELRPLLNLPQCHDRMKAGESAYHRFARAMVIRLFSTPRLSRERSRKHRERG